MTEPITRIVGTAVPLLRASIDTDQIMPKQFLKRIERSGFGPYIFHDWRSSGGLPIDDPAYAGACILIAGENFGCGSSREQAVWGLHDHGFAAVVAPSFAPIFRENAARSLLLTVALPARQVESIAARVATDPSTQIVIDIDRQQLRIGDEVLRFEVDPRTRDCFLLGLDQIGQTLELEAAIGSHERDRPPWLPTTRSVHSAASARADRGEV